MYLDRRPPAIKPVAFDQSYAITDEKHSVVIGLITQLTSGFIVAHVQRLYCHIIDRLPHKAYWEKLES